MMYIGPELTLFTSKFHGPPDPGHPSFFLGQGTLWGADEATSRAHRLRAFPCEELLGLARVDVLDVA